MSLNLTCYVLSIILNRLSGLGCSVYHLRLFNVEVTAYVAAVAILCRTWIEQPGTSDKSPRSISKYAVMTGFNIALFPVMFFFSGLYYTDVISTFVVLVAYLNQLRRLGRGRTELFTESALVAVLGVLALCMRQTNIFWVVVFMGGIEVVHRLKSLRPQPVEMPHFSTLTKLAKFYARRYSLGEIHDPPLNQANPIDLVLCIISDKSNHIATLHLAQLLYIWPLFVFFSAPLFIPQALSIVTSVYRTVFNSATSRSAGQPLKTKSHPANQRAPKRSQALRTVNRLGSSTALQTCVATAGALAAAVAIVRFNTVVHPFTLADNRHYMFYVFRYSILRARWVRYVLAPAYVVCGWLCWTALRAYGDGFPAGPSDTADTFSTSSESSGVSSSHTPAVGGGEKKKDTAAPAINRDDAADSATPPSTSTVLVLLLATSLSLMTAPLVEPRYFMLPWVFWRLHVPAWPSPFSAPSSQSQARGGSSASGGPPAPIVDPRLVLELVWFALINAGTMYVFLARPFHWRAADGTLLDGGRAQRFMW
ncbi:hypothetical protein DL766_010492 [Monosporascus sp. MC13-8B]|uniref:Dol-P-Glc:Glc(2)Man(9)GlcNAc(2)-PP-Dol alpha-1,2-glucosyltransferase n=1 Tax=Monosporascus cannonballus TaxID=155416 RepID=A0ABY0H9Y7_9PEZI|nr:hypothetical protein DL763_008191 [Monosporascus cannonballus]RYO88600.1 hypothetical protein DL762_003636 [Monosporascus cannonballus]RYP02210.1 hypothetical protein DL766_010492 [Monosporascus sp. MC13-8B]